MPSHKYVNYMYFCLYNEYTGLLSIIMLFSLIITDLSCETAPIFAVQDKYYYGIYRLTGTRQSVPLHRAGVVYSYATGLYVRSKL
jgi:hypothetical protein